MGFHDADDVIQETWLIAQTRDYFCNRMLLEAARNLRKTREVLVSEVVPNESKVDYFDNISNDFRINIRGFNDNIDNISNQERLKDVLLYAPPKVRMACLLILNGHLIKEAAAMVGLSQTALSAMLKKLGRKCRMLDKREQLIGVKNNKKMHYLLTA